MADLKRDLGKCGGHPSSKDRPSSARKTPLRATLGDCVGWIVAHKETQIIVALRN